MRTISRVTSVLLLSVVAAGCRDSDEGLQGGTVQTGATSAGGNASVAGKGGGGASGGLSLGGSVSSAAGSGGTSIKPGEACATGTLTASLSGVNLLVMFNRSNSMNDPTNDAGDSRWLIATQALNGFFADPEAAGLDVALRFFPHDLPASGCNMTDCNVTACTQPLVELGTLTADSAPVDSHEQALLSAIGSTVPPPILGEGTPISAALDGALRWAAAQRLLTPMENSVVVLVTDGQASGCDVDTAIIAQLAADALASSGTRTYAVGLTGSVEFDINAIAMAGGTEKGIFVADGAGAQQQLLDALAAIRGAALDCDLPMPKPAEGDELDPQAVNVNLTTENAVKTTLPQVPSLADCGGLAGWYYDNPTAPTRILLCPSTCDTVSADPKAMLEILLGCKTVTDVPR